MLLIVKRRAADSLAGRSSRLVRLHVPRGWAHGAVFRFEQHPALGRNADRGAGLRSPTGTAGAQHKPRSAEGCTLSLPAASERRPRSSNEVLMDFTLTPEQRDPRDAVRALLTGGVPDHGRPAQDHGCRHRLRRARLVATGRHGHPRAALPRGARRHGRRPRRSRPGGRGDGPRLAPEPFTDRTVLAGGLITAAGTGRWKGELLSGLADGSLIAAFAHTEPGSRRETRALQVRAREHDGTWIPSGTKDTVPHGTRADLLVVSAATDAVPFVTGPPS